MAASSFLPPFVPSSGERSLLRTEYKGYRSCLGLLRLAKRYSPARLEAACARAGSVEARSYRHVDSILKHGLDRLVGPAIPPPRLRLPAHEHLRGRKYYQDEDAAPMSAAAAECGPDGG